VHSYLSSDQPTSASRLRVGGRRLRAAHANCALLASPSSRQLLRSASQAPTGAGCDAAIAGRLSLDVLADRIVRGPASRKPSPARTDVAACAAYANASAAPRYPHRGHRLGTRTDCRGRVLGTGRGSPGSAKGDSRHIGSGTSSAAISRKKRHVERDVDLAPPGGEVSMVRRGSTVRIRQRALLG
jgi:hypothetical protein